MTRSKKHSRKYLTVAALGLVTATLVFAFWPRPFMVDLGAVQRASVFMTIDDEGRTRVRDTYTVSTPVAGRLQRVEVRAGDAVEGGETVVAYMRPSNPVALDVRTRAQARAAVDAAKAALRVAQADLNAATAQRDLARAELARIGQLARQGMSTDAELDRARQQERVAQAHVDTATAAISLREADIASAQAQLTSFDDPSETLSSRNGSDAMPVIAPASGRILRVLQSSETSLPAGSPILEIGDVRSDLEVVVELLSTDAVQISVGDRTIIDDWGGVHAIEGEVERIEPYGETRFSALGVEEQRVTTVVRFTHPGDVPESLGHGFRVQAKIVIDEALDVLVVPASALFREAGQWMVFRVLQGRAKRQAVTPGLNDGLNAQIVEGLNEGDPVVLYPSPSLSDGMRVRQTGFDP